MGVADLIKKFETISARDEKPVEAETTQKPAPVKGDEEETTLETSAQAVDKKLDASAEQDEPCGPTLQEEDTTSSVKEIKDEEKSVNDEPVEKPAEASKDSEIKVESGKEATEKTSEEEEIEKDDIEAEKEQSVSDDDEKKDDSETNETVEPENKETIEDSNQNQSESSKKKKKKNKKKKKKNNSASAEEPAKSEAISSEAANTEAVNSESVDVEDAGENSLRQD